MTTTHEPIARRTFGRRPDRVSIIGLGGFHLGKAKTIAEAVRIVHEAIDAGVNFLDNAWEYNDGESERRMGRAIADRRDSVFLMTKVCTHGRDATVALRQLDESLRRLRTDHLDLWQVHECVYYDDPQRHFARGGVVEALERAKAQGKVRYVGFTGHKDPEIHMSLPVCTTVSGVDSLKVLRQNLRIARGFSPMNERQRASYERTLAGVAHDGRFDCTRQPPSTKSRSAASNTASLAGRTRALNRQTRWSMPARARSARRIAKMPAESRRRERGRSDGH